MLWLSVITISAFLAPSCHAAIVGGRLTYINYNSQCGVWNDPTSNSGLILEECCPVDVSYPGTPWQQFSLGYTQGSSRSHFGGNTGWSGCSGPGGYTVTNERVLDDGSGLVGIEHTYTMGLLTVVKTETWDFNGKTIRVRIKVKYTKEAYLGNCKPIEKLSVMHAVDPDQDRNPFGTFQTFNDVIYNGGRGLFAEATGPRSCKTLGYGICATEHPDGSTDQVGFSRWLPTTPATLVDPNGQLRDDTMHYQHIEERPLFCGDEREFGFFIVWGRCNDEARKNFQVAHSRFCHKCYRLDILAEPPKVRCRGECPCQDKDNCSCNYKCNSGPIFTPVDIDASTKEKLAISKACGRRRKKRQDDTFNPDTANIEAATLDEAVCAAAKESLTEGK